MSSTSAAVESHIICTVLAASQWRFGAFESVAPLTTESGGNAGIGLQAQSQREVLTYQCALDADSR